MSYQPTIVEYLVDDRMREIRTEVARERRAREVTTRRRRRRG